MTPENDRAVRLLLAAVGVAAVMFFAARLALEEGNGTLALVLIGCLVVACVVAALADEDEPEEPRRYGADGSRWSMSDDEFEDLVQRVETAEHVPPPPADEFAALVREAIEELPDWVRLELDANVAVVTADDGDTPATYGHADAPGLFGLYVPNNHGASARSGARIVLFRDTLTAAFPDPDDLRREVTTTLRHEVAHHFGADENRVRLLGL